jgi:predicted transcriptional regulator
MGNSTTTTTSERALALLGQNVSTEQVAAALGVTPSAISQLLADPEYTSRVNELKFTNLTKHTSRDSRYDNLEDKLIGKLEDMVEYMTRPMEVVTTLVKINAAKRRGVNAPESITTRKEVVQLVMPVQIINQFQKNSQNQVIQAGEQQLVTVQSATMKTLLQNERGTLDVQTTPATITNNVEHAVTSRG